MKFPVFIFHEIILRLDELNPKIGRYVSSKQDGDVFVLSTDNGSVIVPSHFLKMQFEDPRQLSTVELSILANNFRDAMES